MAGKRSSLGHLNYHLNSIDGVRDGAFWLPPADAARRRRAAGRLRGRADGCRASAILAALRQRVDAAFLPRRIVTVDALPRDATGKLPAARLAALATARCCRATATAPIRG